MTNSKELYSACGLYCGVCGVYIADHTQNQNLKKKLADFYGITVDQIRCNGCNSDLTCKFCESCGIRECAKNKKIAGCHECDSYPCERITQFSNPIGKKNIMRCVPFRRAFGDNLWEQEEKRRYRCPNCGSQLFRGSKKCAQCKTQIITD